MTSSALNFLSRNVQYEIGRLLALLKIFSAKERLPTTSAPSNALVEILSIKKSAQQISGLSEHTVRRLSRTTTYQNETGQAWNIPRVEVGTVGLFENSSVILNGRGYQLFGGTSKREIGMGSTSLKIFSAENRSALHLAARKYF